jgi:Family of unknown function (DUF6084)
MPALNFKVTGIEPATRGLTPLLHFNLEISNEPPGELIQSVMVQAQIQIQAPQRSYSAQEKERLVDLFGTPDRWGQTLGNRLWAHASASVAPFAGSTTTVLPVQCTYDFNVIATKYFYALEGGEVPLLFLFSGTIFYTGADERLQVQQIPWDKEDVYRMPIKVWTELMSSHYPNSAWLSLRRDVFERLAAYKSRVGMLTWDQAVERLLAHDQQER